MSIASTSLEAYHSIDLTELEQMVIDAIVVAGVDGLISDEVRACFPSLSYSSVTARFKALEEKAWIFRAGDTRPGDSGRQQKVMRHVAWAKSAPAVATVSKKNPYMKGFIAAARLVSGASDLAAAREALAVELRKVAKSSAA